VGVGGSPVSIDVSNCLAWEFNLGQRHQLEHAEAGFGGIGIKVDDDPAAE
jgi:hypothetical protein